MSDNPNPNPPTEPTTTPPAETTNQADPSLLGGTAQPTEAAPEPFDLEKLTIPEGINKDHESFKNFTAYAKEAGFTQPQANKLVELHHAALKASTDSIYDAWREQQTKWVDEVKKDPEVGNTDKVRETVGRMLDDPRFGDPKFREALDFTGAGNHPAVVRTLFRIANALTEGGLVQGDPAKRDATGATTERPDPARSLYGPSGPVTGGPNIPRG